jgi:RNA-dependent RNA polymerase
VSVAKRESRRQRRLAGSEEDLAEVCDFMCEVSSHEPTWHPPIRKVVEAHVAQHVDLTELHWEDVKTASRLFRHYAATLREHCAHNSVSQARGALLTEEEALAGTIVAKTAQARRRQELISRLREDTDITVRDVRAELRDSRDGDTLETRLYRAWVAWRLSVVEHAAFGGMSFWWITLGAVLDAVRAIDDRNRGLERRGA